MRESLRGFDFKKALDVLEEAGAFPMGRDAGGSRARVFRIRGTGARYYPVNPNKLRNS
jgi:putative DNA primase/helicase